jgi:CubicO group peptidase (beta-lactamase class C family)
MTMPVLPKSFSLLLLSFGFSCVLFCTACNSVHKEAKKNNADTIHFINLPEPLPVSDADAARFKIACQSWYDSVLMARGFSGGMIVAKNGNIVYEKYQGTGHIPGTDLITDSTALHIASISKTFTAMAVLKLQQDGKLNIDDELRKYFPAFNYPGLTIRMLLNHRSGLPNYNYFMQNLGWDLSRFVKNEDVLDYLITQKTALPEMQTPGAHFSYCNTNYALLALLIEKITGLTYTAYLNRTFFVPLNMKNTYVFSLADTLKATPSYNWRGVPEAFNFLDQVYGDKNIYSTPRDLLIWDRALSSGLLFTEETLAQAYAPYSNERPGQRNYGLGWRMHIFPDDNKIIYHNGWWHGSNATFIRLLKEKATIIVIGNKFNRSVYHAKVLTSLFGNYYVPADDEENLMLKDSLKSEIPVSQNDSNSKSNKVKTQMVIRAKKDNSRNAH